VRRQLLANAGRLTGKQERFLRDMTSRSFAKNASGQVAAFVREANVERTFLSVELPILNNNPNLTGISGYIFEEQ
jgi:hypothetical protein